MTTTFPSTQSSSPVVETIIEHFSHFVEKLNGHSLPLLRGIRQRAIEEFRRLGVPTIRHEDWKYTNLFPLLSKQFVPPLTDIHAENINDVLGAFTRWGSVIPIVNGKATVQQTAYLRSLQSAFLNEPRWIERLGRLAPYEGNAIVAWNTAFMLDGIALAIPDRVVLDEPIVLASVITPFDANTIVHERHLIEIGSHATATIVLVQRTVGNHEALLNQVVEAWVGEGAMLTVILLQDGEPNTHTLTTHEFSLSQNARLHLVTVSIGGGFIRNMPAARLSGEGADTQLYGLTIADGSMLVDHHTVVDHRVPQCTSNELYKAILDGRSTGVFNGKIFVQPNAQKTSAYQANRNIVLSSRATINTKPQLEIFANDVRCTHGCTVGRLDAEAMFYLRSRGLSKAEAEALLLSAFAEEITAQIPYPLLREDVNARIEHLLHADELA